MHKIKYLSLIALSVLFVSSCVPTRQFQELKEKNTITVSERDSLKSTNESLTIENTEMEAELITLRKKAKKLAKEKSNLNDSANYYTKQYKVYKTMYDELMSNQKLTQKGYDEETRKLLAELQVMKEDLQVQEDELRKLQESLLAKESALKERDAILMALDSTLNQKRFEIEDQSKQLAELEQLLYSKDSAVMALKTKITDALVGFEDKGLSVHQRHGKVYVTMDNKLMFKSGKWNVDPQGQQALKQISGVLAQNKDINVLVEGHTDDVPMAGSGDIKDNWDLSVKRATSIVKIILKSAPMDPKRITAAGRGPYFPIDDAKTSEARAKNRRTEIILTPKLDEIFKILETN